MRNRFLILTVICWLCVVAALDVASAETITLRHAIWGMPQKPATEEAIRLFEEKNPGIKVELEVIAPFASYWDKIKTTMTAGTAPDVIWMNHDNFKALSFRNVLLNLQPYIDKDLEAQEYLADMSETIIEPYRYEGDIYGFPKDLDTIGLFYNKELFDDAGLSYPDENWTWSDYLTNAQKLTKQDARGRTVQYGTISDNSDQTNWLNFVWANGGRLLNDNRTQYALNEPEGREAIEFLVDLIHKYKVSATVGAIQEQGARELFTTGRTAMKCDGSWSPRYFREAADFDWGVAPLPKGKAGRICMTHGLAYTVPIGTKHPDAAYKFAKFMASERAQTIFGSTGTVIPARRVAMDTYFDQGESYNLEVFREAINYSRTFPYTITTPEWRAKNTQALDWAWVGEKSVAEALEEAAKVVNSVLDEEYGR
jgi:multiple sugar transport system substrate-binding protein